VYGPELEYPARNYSQGFIGEWRNSHIGPFIKGSDAGKINGSCFQDIGAEAYWELQD
jgi:hypothetical protein